MKPATNFFLLLLLVAAFATNQSKAYSVFAHEAIIDASWDKAILPLLKKKYPQATDDDLKNARSYAYGGSLIADMGYFPLGNEYFTNLIHYVRSGDFVENLLAEAQNLNEYAFAIGALSHYLTDKYGHSLATNLAVPIVYSKLRKKFGPVVTYEENPLAHSRMEFAFDVLQTARGNYLPQAYHNFIGFNVATPVLERAFLKTYGQDINEVFGDLSLTIGTFRWTVRSLLPGITRTAWEIKKDDIKKANPAANYRSFHYKLKRKEYKQEFGMKRDKPKFGARFAAFLIEILPKVGPLKTFKFKQPGPEGEKLFISSFDTVLVYYANDLNRLQYQNITMPNIDFDTGKNTVMGEYGLTDETYCDMVIKLQQNKYYDLTANLKNNILDFYNSSNRSNFAAKDPGEWQKAQLDLQHIKQTKVIPTDSLKTLNGLYYKQISDTTYNIKR